MSLKLVLPAFFVLLSLPACGDKEQDPDAADIERLDPSEAFTQGCLSQACDLGEVYAIGAALCEPFGAPPIWLDGRRDDLERVGFSCDSEEVSEDACLSLCEGVGMEATSISGLCFCAVDHQGASGEVNDALSELACGGGGGEAELALDGGEVYHGIDCPEPAEAAQCEAYSAGANTLFNIEGSVYEDEAYTCGGAAVVGS